MLLATAGIVGLSVATLVAAERRSERLFRSLPHRVLVGGGRGKSTLARIMHAAIAARGINAVARITGDEPLMILQDGSLLPVVRPGLPNIREIRRDLAIACDRGAWATVFENMAVDPDLMTVVGHRLYKPTVAIFGANVRDHVDEWPVDPVDRAALHLRSVPAATPCVVPADDSSWQAAASRLGREVILARPLDDPAIKRPYLAVLAGVALRAMQVIDRSWKETAAIASATQSASTLHVADANEVFWVDLLSANDPESTQSLIRQLVAEQTIPPHAVTLVYQHVAKRLARLEDFAELLRRVPSAITGDEVPRTVLQRLKIQWVSPAQLMSGTWHPGKGRVAFLIGNTGSHGRVIRAWHRQLGGQQTW